MPKEIKLILLDFSYTLCFPKTDEHIDSLNGLYSEIMQKNNSANPLDSFILNQELLDFLKTQKANHKIFVFTSGHMHTDPVIAQYLFPVFDGYITSTELGLPKSFPDVYKVIANKLDVDTEEILFVDDQQKNVLAAQTAGAQAIRFTNNTEVIEEIKKILEKSH